MWWVGSAMLMLHIGLHAVGLAALILHQIRHHSGPLGPQEGQIARLAQMHLDSHVLAVHVNVAEAGGHDEAGELLQQILPEAGALL